MMSAPAASAASSSSAAASSSGSDVTLPLSPSLHGQGSSIAAGRIPSHAHTGTSSMSHTHSNPHSAVMERPQVYGGGRQGAKPYQEDSFFSWCSPTNRVIVGGIFDGHGGYNGLLASQTARDASLAYLQANATECEEWSVDRWRTALSDLFSHLHATIRQSFIANFGAPSAPAPGHSFTNSKPPTEQRHIDEKGIVRNAAGDPIHGGSTATLVVMVKDANGSGATLICANAGDSTAFLVPTRGTWDFLSVDHGPENQEEWQRVNSNPQTAPNYSTKLLFVYDKTNVFRKYECPNVFLPDGTKDQSYVANPWGYGLHPTNVRYEPAVYAVTPRSVSKDSTCIAMTRALGDFYAHQFGLTHAPSISVKRISCADSGSDDTTQTHSNSYATSEQAYTIFLASDGVWDCFTDDAQLLTSDGFKGVDELVELESRGALPLFATMDESMGELQYRQSMVGPTGRHVLVKPASAGPFRMVDIVSSSEEDSSAEINLSVTANHEMLVKRGRADVSDPALPTLWDSIDGVEQPAQRVKAGELVEDDEHNVGATKKGAAVQFVCSAAAGLREGPDSVAAFAAPLELHTEQQVDAFIELYGLWLGVGEMEMQALRFTCASPALEARVSQLLQQAGLREGSDFSTADTGDCVRVHSARWVRFFASIYAGLDASTRCVFTWTLQLGCAHAQRLLRGLQAAAGEQAQEGQLCVSSILLRDQLLIIALHAGYSAHFTLPPPSLSNLTSDDADASIPSAAPEATSWLMRYSLSSAASSTPSLSSSRDIHRRMHHGRVWCVSVPPHHLLIARRITSLCEKTQQVLAASRPTLVGNCWKYDDLMQFINDELIKRHKTLLEMGEAVLEESISRAITNFGAKHYDDACLVVWQFQPTRVTNATQAEQQQNGIPQADHASASSSSAATASSSADTEMSS